MFLLQSRSYFFIILDLYVVHVSKFINFCIVAPDFRYQLIIHVHAQLYYLQQLEIFMRGHESSLPLPKCEGEDTIFEFVVAENGDWEHWKNRVRFIATLWQGISAHLWSAVCCLHLTWLAHNSHTCTCIYCMLVGLYTLVAVLSIFILWYMYPFLVSRKILLIMWQLWIIPLGGTTALMFLDGRFLVLMLPLISIGRSYRLRSLPDSANMNKGEVERCQNHMSC